MNFDYIEDLNEEKILKMYESIIEKGENSLLSGYTSYVQCRRGAGPAMTCTWYFSGSNCDVWTQCPGYPRGYHTCGSNYIHCRGCSPELEPVT